MEKLSLELYWQKLIDLMIKYGGKFLIAVIIWIVGLLAVKMILRMTKAALMRSKMELTVTSFILSLLSFGLKLLLFITCATIVGIKMTAFVAIIGAMGLAFGLALQGSLSNFAGGVLITLLKPYKMGDFIETNGIMGTVREITIFNTVLNTPDNKRIILPNGSVSNNNITNYSAEPVRRVNLEFGVDYNTDIEKAKKIIREVIERHPKTLSDPEPFVRVGNYAASSIDITVRVWVNLEDYWDVHFDLLEQVKTEFDKAEIVIPFQQIDVSIKK